jgi:hypothetical protein
MCRAAGPLTHIAIATPTTTQRAAAATIGWNE